MSIETQSEAGESEIYSRCTRKENALTLQDLCDKCPIPFRIKEGLPRIKAEIEVHRQGNTRAGFLRYCEKALTNHVEKAARFANDLANPAKAGSLPVGNLLEIKFWNLALCELYKVELEPLQPVVSTTAVALVDDESKEYHPYPPHIKKLMDLMHEQHLHSAQLSTLAAQTAAANAQKAMVERTGQSLEDIEPDVSLLPSKIAESHTYFTALLKTCAQLPRYDVTQTLRAAFEQHRAKGFYAWSDFVQRLPTYIAQHLSNDVQQMLNAHGGLLTSFRATLRVAELQPENWPFWGVDERHRLLMRQKDVVERLELAQQQERPANVAEHTETLACIASILTALDAAVAAGNFVVNASEINASSAAPVVKSEAPSQTSPLLPTAELRAFYLKLLQHPAFAEELSLYQKSELLAYAEQEKMNGVRLAVELMDSNPSYAYPNEYKNGREAEYWMEKSANYRDSVRVLQLLAPPTKPASLSTLATIAPVLPHPFTPLLLNYSVPQLRELLEELGLVGTDGHAVPAASPGAWVGVIHGLLDATPPRLRNNKAAVQRAFCEHFGAVVGERAVQAGLGKHGSEAERFRDSTLALLRGQANAE
ncbi:hypothetical protein IC235_17385 [Hymenobacter sp. BT664]|uniref:Uncharacterized protein n=1 Tax=Hymenobacter montanus TaxID=2771359 RepID=A0A927BFV2_9BACT|nr:hypothetical protein [Hymenobacter montanus]MBD2769666.1 hypothetical protein [Hymenobacter montanus]